LLRFQSRPESSSYRAPNILATMSSQRAQNVLVLQLLAPMSSSELPALRQKFPGFPGTGNSRQPLDIASRSTAPAPEKGQIRPIFSNSLLNSLLAGKCGWRKQRRCLRAIPDRVQIVNLVRTAGHDQFMHAQLIGWPPEMRMHGEPLIACRMAR